MRAGISRAAGPGQSDEVLPGPETRLAPPSVPGSVDALGPPPGIARSDAYPFLQVGITLLKKHKAKAFEKGHAASTDFVFCTSTGQPHYFRNVATRGLDKAANTAGLNREGVPKLTSHDLRHTAISRWIAAGLDVVEVARQSGDTKEVIRNTYAAEFHRASRAAEIRSKIEAGTSISLP